jgi:hypothetical protein
MVSRRHLLLSGATLVTAGCAARSSPSTRSTTSTGTNRATSAPSTTPTLDCAGATVRTPPDATTSDDDVTPPAYPDFPDSLDTDSVASFVSDYESAYVVNELLATTRGVNHVDFTVSDSPPVTETDRGFVVDLAYRFSVEAGTAADYPPRHVAYLVRPDVVARAEIDADEEPLPFPVARATVFRCEA